MILYLYRKSQYQATMTNSYLSSEPSDLPGRRGLRGSTLVTPFFQEKSEAAPAQWLAEWQLSGICHHRRSGGAAKLLGVPLTTPRPIRAGSERALTNERPHYSVTEPPPGSALVLIKRKAVRRGTRVWVRPDTFSGGTLDTERRSRELKAGLGRQ